MNSKIKITTIQTEYRGKSMFERMAQELLIEETFSDMDGSGTIETTLYGDIKISDKDYTLSYEEVEESGLGKTETVLKFCLDTPNEISLSRTGEISSYMYFEEKKRHICVYDSGIIPFEICIYTRSIDNRLISDGFLEIEYIIEIKGACAQKTVLRMEAKSL